MGNNDLTPELMERAKACKTDEELNALFKSEGIELTMEQLDAFAGGTGSVKNNGRGNCNVNWCTRLDCRNNTCPDAKF